MAFNGDNTVQQLNEGSIQLTDTSTGSDVTITERRISLITYNPSITLIPAGTATTYIVWPLADLSITLNDILPKDYALNVKVEWITQTPDPNSVYTKTGLYLFESYNMLELGGIITERMARDPNIVRDTDFITSFFAFYANIIGARISVGLLNDIFKAQYCLELATNMRIEDNIIF